MAKASRDTQKGRKRVKGKRKGEKEKKREGEKKRERERERERRGKGEKDKNTRTKAGVPSYAQASRATPRRGVYLSVTFRNTPKRQREKKGRVGGGRGLRLRQTPTSLEQASAAAATYAMLKWLAALTAIGHGHVKA